MPGPLPKPQPTRVRSAPPTFPPSELPHAGREGSPPELPGYRAWSPTTVAAWAFWWSTPQATRWDQSGRTLHRWAILHDRIVTDPDANAALHTALLAIEDRHGMSPAAMLKLRWVVAEPKRTTGPQYDGKSSRARRLGLVDDHE